MKIFALLVLLTLLGHSYSFASTDRIYISPMVDSSWVLTSNSQLRCEIEHVIPRFGKAVFFQESGRRLQLKVTTNHDFKKDLDISFRSVTANWKGIHTEANLADLKTTGSSPLIHIGDNIARQAYFELQQGYQPSLFFIDDEDGFNSVAVILSTVRFRDVEAEFKDCVNALYPQHFDDINRALVHFDFDEEFPKVEEEDKVLSKMLNYLKVDSSVKYFQIIGHTDYKGTECYNETLSARRAWYIYDYMIQSGIEPAQLRIEFKGESDPIRNGKDDFSRAINRRVEVKMIK